MTSPHLIIHRATHEIGGNCVEITDEETRLLFDFGLPLISIKEKKPARDYRLPICGVYQDQEPNIAAVFLTHAHPDHYGLLTELNPQIPVYASQAAVNLLQHIAPLFGQSFSHLHLIPLSPNKTVKIGTFSIKSLPVDHSAPESFAYQICIGNKRILYTGDLRTHGKCGYLTKKLANAPKPDYLLLEGTTLSRPKKQTETEENLQVRLEKALAGSKLPIIYFSAQNLDRFVSVYKSALALNKTLVIDPYTCFVLEQFAHLGKSIPQWNWRNIRVYFAYNSLTRKLRAHLSKYNRKKITLKEIFSAPEKYIVKDNFVLRRHLLKGTQQVRLIHSAWEGYLEDDNAFVQDAQQYNLPITLLHTSGHGDYSTLQRLVQKLSPRLLSPIHTTRANDYERLFQVPTRILKDGEIFSL